MVPPTAPARAACTEQHRRTNDDEERCVEQLDGHICRSACQVVGCQAVQAAGALLQWEGVGVHHMPGMCAPASTDDRRRCGRCCGKLWAGGSWVAAGWQLAGSCQHLQDHALLGGEGEQGVEERPEGREQQQEEQCSLRRGGGARGMGSGVRQHLICHHGSDGHHGCSMQNTAGAALASGWAWAAMSHGGDLGGWRHAPACMCRPPARLWRPARCSWRPAATTAGQR